jgi:ABC-type amino acid transport substrate-binding protein
MKKIYVYIIIGLVAATTLFMRKTNRHAPTASLDTIIVGTNTEFPPFSFKENEKTITGFDIEVITEALNRLGKKIVIKDMPFDALIPEIQLGKIHIIAAGITPTPERAQRTLFTEPHLVSDKLVIISKKDNPYTSINELKNKTVIVNEGYNAEQFMLNYPEVNLVSLASNAPSDGMLTLKNGRADAFVTAYYPITPYFATTQDESCLISPIPNTEENSAFAVSKYYPEFRDAIQIMLDRMKEDGTLDALKRKWNLV